MAGGQQPLGRRDRSHFRGCLLGGAVGDALGEPVEFMSLREIRERYGPGGILKPGVSSDGVARITDDTQMTLFTAEGLLRDLVRFYHDGICNPPLIVWHAYLRWLRTQGVTGRAKPPLGYDGWLLQLPELHARRAPGTTCVSALAAGDMGRVDRPLNGSKGCGGVMRVAPVGLVRVQAPFDAGCELAALTHGHPSGYLAAGALALIIDELISGSELGDAVDKALKVLRGHRGSEECVAAVEAARALAREGTPSVEKVERLGRGFVAEEALAIAVYCALSAENDFANGVRLAVNHGGDSDSTGAITGNILGAMLGVEVIPATWLERLELRDAITTIADDLLTRYEDGDSWRARYPPT